MRLPDSLLAAEVVSCGPFTFTQAVSSFHSYDKQRVNVFYYVNCVCKFKKDSQHVHPPRPPQKTSHLNCLRRERETVKVSAATRPSTVHCGLRLVLRHVYTTHPQTPHPPRHRPFQQLSVKTSSKPRPLITPPLLPPPPTTTTSLSLFSTSISCTRTPGRAAAGRTRQPASVPGSGYRLVLTVMAVCLPIV